MSASQAPTILLDKQPDGVAVLRLNRPERLNAFTLRMIDDWQAALRDAFDDAAVRVVIVTGNGKAFCTGADLDELAAAPPRDGIERKDVLWAHIHGIARILDAADKPVIAAVNGTARGAGCDMTLMCDLRIAAASATFAESYIHHGLVSGDAGAYYLPRLIGSARALELFWTGRVIGAAEAERIGLVNQVVPDEQLMETALQLARQIAAQPQQAVRLYKRMVRQSPDMALPTHLDMVSSHMSVLQDTPEYKARLAASLAKLGKRAS